VSSVAPPPRYITFCRQPLPVRHFLDSDSTLPFLLSFSYSHGTVDVSREYVKNRVLSGVTYSPLALRLR
jgi:hypothetical protein